MRSLKAPHLLEEPLMPRIGLRELKIHLSEVAKDVQQNDARYTVTNRGEPVALLVPYSRAAETNPEDPAAAWKELADLLHEAGRRTPATESTEDLMDWSRGR
jgi:prevent-host-death family protein